MTRATPSPESLYLRAIATPRETSTGETLASRLGPSGMTSTVRSSAIRIGSVSSTAKAYLSTEITFSAKHFLKDGLYSPSGLGTTGKTSSPITLARAIRKTRLKHGLLRADEKLLVKADAYILNLECTPMSWPTMWRLCILIALRLR